MTSFAIFGSQHLFACFVNAIIQAWILFGFNLKIIMKKV